jgi:hypothetical protein
MYRVFVSFCHLTENSEMNPPKFQETIMFHIPSIQGDSFAMEIPPSERGPHPITGEFNHTNIFYRIGPSKAVMAVGREKTGREHSPADIRIYVPSPGPTFGKSVEWV